MSVYLREQVMKCHQDDLMRTAAACRQVRKEVGRKRRTVTMAMPMQQLKPSTTRRFGGMWRSLSNA
jgi:hypothetical protein